MRNAAFMAIGVTLIILQANLYRVLGPLGSLLGPSWVHGVTPSLVLPLIIFLGVHEYSMARGALLAFGLGYAVDVLASAPIGLFTFVAVAIWWLARVAGVRLTAQTIITRMSLAFAFCIVETAMVLMLLAVFGSDNRRPVELASIALPHAISTALCSPVVFWIAQRLHQGSASVHATNEGGVR
jgi:rod shape-determining protein MreD